MLKTRISYYEYHEGGGVQVTLDLEFSYPENLIEFLEKIKGPVCAPPEVGDDGKLKEKKEVEQPADVDLSKQRSVTYPSDHLLSAAAPIKEKKE